MHDHNADNPTEDTVIATTLATEINANGRGILNSSKIFALCIAVGTACVAWGGNQMAMSKRFDELHTEIATTAEKIASYTAGESKRTDKLEASVEYMKLHGHDEHERRLSKLETQDVTLLGNNVVNQGKQIEALTGAVTKLAELQTKDHDSLVRMVVLYEGLAKKANATP